ncbi:hypothetical protein HMN09_00364900 [Mycena chlorophos]|uniref:Thioesterase domain-containing protein n=1 Tax=Mycena chlorophos TaxID=658473 RepID=A0A8H6TKV2_MYCCL|nr:hypothetical protein HMN09_00364900 [Mycena chlorophos]
MSSPPGSSKPKPVNRDRNADNTARLAQLLEIPPVPWSRDIRGNPPQADKDLIASVFAFFIQGGIMPEAFGKDVGARVKMVEMNVVEDGRGTEGFWEVEVTQDMCNAFGTMHGACAAFLVDHTTIGTMVFLGRVRGFDGIGMTGDTRHVQCIWNDARRVRRVPRRPYHDWDYGLPSGASEGSTGLG